MNLKNTKILFYAVLAITIIIHLLPFEYKTAPYGANYLGWGWILFLVPSVVILYFTLLVKYWKVGNQKEIVIPTLILTISIVFGIFYWYWMAGRLN